jgi:DNA-binding Xre family transcriptional regulator
LVNSTDGGDGVSNISGEGRKRMLETWKGRKHKPESIKKMIMIRKGKKNTEKSKDLVSEKMKGREIKWKDKLVEAKRKFTDSDLKKIKKDLQKMMVKEVADKYGVHRTTISKIKKGEYKTFKQKTVNYVKPRRYHES